MKKVLLSEIYLDTKNSVEFAKKKFLSFSIMKQHKKCAEILKALVLSYSKKQLDHYNEIQSWMNHSPILCADFESLCTRYHHHIDLAGMSLSEYQFLPNITRKDRSAPLRKSLNIAIYLDNLRSAHNIGSIIRTTEAFSLGELYFSENMITPDHAQVLKTSMGASEHVISHGHSTLDQLPRPWIAMETCKQAQPLHEVAFPKKFTLILGNEEYGCSSTALEKSDLLIQIPLFGRKNSLNVANAFAIAAAEISKQKHLKT